MVAAVKTAVIIIVLLIGAMSAPQSAGASAPEFEVASVKPSRPLPAGQNIRLAMGFGPERVTAKYFSLKRLIAEAYGIESYQIFGGPDWLDSIRYDVEAKTQVPAKNSDLLLMLQVLLADRFKLKLHRETRDLPVYAMLVAKNGPKFHPLEAGAFNRPSKPNYLRFKDLSFLASTLSRFGSEFPVIDRTGLKGDFDLELNMSKAEQVLQSGDAANMGAAMAYVAQDELGLKLVRTKAPIEVFVVDRAEKANQN